MSLFPAYGDNEPAPAAETATSGEETENIQRAAGGGAGQAFGYVSDHWRRNVTFHSGASSGRVGSTSTWAMTRLDSSRDSSDIESDVSTASTRSSGRSRSGSPAPSPKQMKTKGGYRRLEFDSTDEFYVDKERKAGHREMKTLPRLSRPRYKVMLRRIEDPVRKCLLEQNTGRHKLRWKRLLTIQKSQAVERFSEYEIDEMQDRIRELRRLIVLESSKVAHWVELHELLAFNLDRANRLALAEQQLQLIKGGLTHHPGNEMLLNYYINTASANFPASEVATKIEELLDRDPYDLSLWTALIMATQGTMSRCNVPDVLRIYEKSMRRMHLGFTSEQRRQHQSIVKPREVDTDPIMMKLFHNCVLFMRQSSNSGHAFALLRLALELNVPSVTFDCFEACAADEQSLIDYEEVVLRSGMPMSEIWTRIERLRQAFWFLPYPQQRHTPQSAAAAGLDPQRCIYNDDVCHYIYPLKSESNQLHLLLLAVQLTKFPFVRTNCLAERLCTRIEQLGDSDAIEMLLAGIGDRYTYALPLQRQSEFTAATLDMVKELSVSPTFMPHSIGHELYEKCISSLLLKAAQAFPLAADEAKRRVFIILWFRFERLRLVLLKLSRKLNVDYVREARQRIRRMLQDEKNRKVSRFFTELGMFEFELLERGDNEDAALRIFKNIVIAQTYTDEHFEDSDLIHSYVTHAEMLISLGHREKALYVLTCLGLDHHPNIGLEEVKLRRQQSLGWNQQQLNDQFKVLKSAPGEMQLEEYFMTSKLLLLLRARCLMLCLLGLAPQAYDYLQHLLSNEFGQDQDQDQMTQRKAFYREQVLELVMLVLQLPMAPPMAVIRPSNLPSSSLLNMLDYALTEFPRNLSLLQRWATLSTLPWHKLRARLIRTKAGILSLLHMNLAARCRFIYSLDPSQSDEVLHQREHLESVVRNRVLCMFETFLPTNQKRSVIEAEQYEILRRNSLYWRCYLRSLSDKCTSFERGKQCLLIALDECPWDKALYMDGAIYVPQELVHMQDVMSEKQIRIYALPEELDILRQT